MNLYLKNHFLVIWFIACCILVSWDVFHITNGFSVFDFSSIDEVFFLVLKDVSIGALVAFALKLIEVTFRLFIFED